MEFCKDKPLFTSIKKDSTGQVAEVNMGTCFCNGESFPCVEKIWKKSEEDSFEEFVKVNGSEDRNIKAVLDKYGPHVHYVKNMTAYMEWISCQDMRTYFKGFNLETDTEKIKEIIGAIEECLEFMKDHGVCHGDFHGGNVLVCGNENIFHSIRLIDIDTMKINYKCGDAGQLYADIIYQLSTKPPTIDMADRLAMQTYFMSRREKIISILNGILQEISPGNKSIKNPDLSPEKQKRIEKNVINFTFKAWYEKLLKSKTS